MAKANRHSAHIEYIKPNTKVKTQRLKVPDDEDIDIAKIVKDDKPKHDRKRATEIERQLREKEAKRPALEKAKRIRIEKDMKDKEAKGLASEKAKIEAFVEKHRPCTPKTPDELNTLGTGKNANTDGQKGTEKVKPPHKKQQKIARLKHPKRRVKKLIKVTRIHC